MSLLLARRMRAKEVEVKPEPKPTKVKQKPVGEVPKDTEPSIKKDADK